MWDGRRTPMRRVAVAVLAASAALAALPSSAGAVLSGTNGRIAFTSGRASGDAQAQLYLRTTIGSQGGGTLSAPLTPTSFQSRHPSWSPDRTQLVFAGGTPGTPTTEHYDILIKDLESGSITPLANSNTNTADHPAWSPDGTRIAYEEAPSAGSADRDIKVKLANSVATPPMTLSAAAGIREFKAAWSPDSQFIYYAKDNPNPQFLDIVKRPSTGGPETAVQAASGIDEYQPSISPDGTKMCFTLQTTPGNSNTSNIYVVDLPVPGALTKISADNPNGNINCTWSPDGTKIAYVEGTFSNGALVYSASDGSQLAPTPVENVANRFDGNPDWAPDGRPTCPDSSIATKAGQPVAIPLACTDTGPAYEQTPVNESISNDGAPAHGSVGPVTQGSPSTIVYTPNQGFTGTDTIKFIGRDDFAFGSDRGTVTITVQAPGTTDKTPPLLWQLRLKPQKFKKRTTVSFQLSEPSTVTFRVAKVAGGRKVNGKCRKLTSKNRKRKKCDLTLSGSIVRGGGKVGANKFTYKGRLKGRKLRPGSYLLLATARDAAGNTSTPARKAKFTIKK
jgi:Tol biopolymer transport system component